MAPSSEAPPLIGERRGDGSASLETVLDRYAARNANFVLVVRLHSGLAARSAARKTGNQPRALRGISRAEPWLVLPRLRRGRGLDGENLTQLAKLWTVKTSREDFHGRTAALSVSVE
jgi:hypothetical protein